MVRALVVVVALLAGCERWNGPEPLWSIDAVNRNDDSLNPLIYATSGLDGETIAAVLNTRLGGRELVDSHVVRIAADGAIVGVGAVPEIGVQSPVEIGIDAADRPTVLWAGSGEHWVVAFDEPLQQRWRHPAMGQAPNTPIQHEAFAVGPGGEVTYTGMDQSGRDTLHYLDANGSERWTASPRFVYRAAITDNGDVLVYAMGRRVRHAAADGTVVEDIAWPGISAIARDGTSVYVEPASGDVFFFDASGEERWHQVVSGIGACPFGGCTNAPLERSTLVSMFAGGDVLVSVEESRVVRLGHRSGIQVGRTDHCAAIALVGSDAAGYIALGRTCNTHYALAKYALPD